MIKTYGKKVAKYLIQIDAEKSVSKKSHLSINYKTELKDGISYTPVFYKHEEGIESGLLYKTEYYKDYVDDVNKGTLILIVEEVYTIDQSDTTISNSAKPTISRTKTWKHIVSNTGLIDEIDIKVKTKLYNTREKQHKEGIRRRQNIEEQLIDNVSLGGILSGAFSSSSDAHNKLSDMQKTHSAAFEVWLNGGRGSIYDDITNETTTLWLDNVIPDNATTQAMIPQMVGLSLRTYIVEKLKGNIK